MSNADCRPRTMGLLHGTSKFLCMSDDHPPTLYARPGQIESTKDMAALQLVLRDLMNVHSTARLSNSSLEGDLCVSLSGVKTIGGQW